MIIFIILSSIFTLEQPHVKNFLKASSKSGEYKYVFIKPVQCLSGKLKKSYALALNGKVILKQISEDGNIGSVCDK